MKNVFRRWRRRGRRYRGSGYPAGLRSDRLRRNGISVRTCRVESCAVEPFDA
ncbi:hypothetical protein ACFYTQ_14400 [Nocardia sp. NPDC004068]|uniref:hypothetical protein n=1 Tax=Nocardia sp. NPDC004068 TaxID=3364303 RepID=UPI0036AD9350